jgi:hypothetical protein
MRTTNTAIYPIRTMAEGCVLWKIYPESRSWTYLESCNLLLSYSADQGMSPAANRTSSAPQNLRSQLLTDYFKPVRIRISYLRPVLILYSRLQQRSSSKLHSRVFNINIISIYTILDYKKISHGNIFRSFSLGQGRIFQFLSARRVL